MAAVSPNLKYYALAALCIQNSALILSMRYSRSVLHDTYLDSTIVVVMELTKLLVSTVLVMRDGGTVPHLLSLLRTSLPISVPSIMYVVQNTCQLTAVQNLDASTFSVLSQAKVLTTAICSVIVLRVNLSSRKWRGLALLVLGCVLVQYTPAPCIGDLTESADVRAAKASSTAFGLMMTLIMVSISGVAGVTIERILKNQGPGMAQMSIWERNVQLSFWGFLFALASMLVQNREQVATNGFFAGWSSFAVIVVICQSIGGLVTAVVVKYTNTIIKGFAVGLSVVLTSMLSVLLFDLQLTLIFCVGASAVLLSIFNFNEEDAPAVTVSGVGGVKKHSAPLSPAAERLALLREQEQDELDLEMPVRGQTQSSRDH